jgi:hypothetical protein
MNKKKFPKTSMINGKQYYRRTLSFQVLFVDYMLNQMAEVMRVREMTRMDVIKDAIRLYIQEFKKEKSA